MKLSACIVVYNGYDEALKAAQTVLHCTRRYPVTLYLVDNASPDGSGKKLEQAVADGGAAGGFEEKARAAQDTGAQLIVIRRPAEQGETAEQILTRCKEMLQ